VGNSIAPQDEYLALHLGGDYTKYLAMRRDTEVRRSLTRLRLAIQARDLVVEASSEARADLKAADQVRSLLGLGGGRAKLRYESLTSTLLDSGMVCGFAVLRLDYHEHGDLLLPSFQFVPQNRFAFTHHKPDDRSIPVCTGEDLDPATEITTVGGYELRLLTRKHPFTGERCPIKRFLVYTFDGDGSPWGLGLGYSIWPWWTIKNEARKVWLLHSDRAGSPPILGTHPVNFSEKIPDQATVLQSFNNFLRAVSPQGWARLPQGFTAQTLDTVGKAGSEVHEGLIRTANHEICKVILGEVLYSDQSSGSYAANISQVEDRESGLIDGYCNLLDEQLSDFWLWIHEVNRLPGDPPIVRRETRADLRSAERAEQEEKAKQSRIDRDKSLLELGIRLKPDRVAQVYGEDYIDTAAVAAEEDGGEPQQALFSQLQTGGTQALIGFITGFAQSGLSKDNAIALLKSVFGIPSDAAAALLPDVEEAAEEALPPTPEETADLLDQDFAEGVTNPIDWLTTHIQQYQPESSIDWLTQQIHQYSAASAIDWLAQEIHSFDFAAARKGRKTEKNCTVGFSCGYACISRNKACVKALEGQAKNYADWLKNQLQRGKKFSPLHEAEAQNRRITAKEARRTAFADKWRSSWDNAPDDLKAVLDRIDDPNQYERKTQSAFYWAPNESISVGDLTPKALGAAATWRHEYGHHLDNKIAEALDRSRLQFRAEADPSNFISSSVEGHAAFRRDEAGLVQRREQREARHIQAAAEYDRYADHPRIQALVRLADEENSSPEDRAVAIGRTINRLKTQEDVEAEAARRSIDPMVAAEERIAALPESSLTREFYFQSSGNRSLRRAVNILADADDPEVIATLAGEAIGGESQSYALDLLGSITLNRLGGGHSNDYYQSAPVHRQNTESFANLISLYGSGHPVSDRVLQDLTPNGYAFMRSTLARINNAPSP